jgi:hypothetical protein
MGFLMIPGALIAGSLMGYPDEVIAAGTVSAVVARFVVDVVRDWMEAVL